MIRPHSLGSYLVESGFCNQLWVLAGLVLQSVAHHEILCLPPFRTHVHEKTHLIPFDHLLDPNALSIAFPSIRATCDNATTFTRHDGWRSFKKVFAATRTLHNGSHAQQWVVDRLYDHIQPSQHIRPFVERTVQSFSTTFDCVHARIESDIAHVAARPQLADFERAHSAFGDPTAAVFVASGTIPRTLKRGWITSTSFPIKSSIDEIGTNASYTTQAAIDFFTCERADRFVGYAASSFSRVLAEKFLRQGKQVVFACVGGKPPVVVTNVTRLYTHWTLCPTERSLKRGSFGWAR